MRNVLVTGATGFIGNYVIAELLRFRCEVTATSLHEEKAKRCDWYKKVKYLPLDLKQLEDDRNYFEYYGKPSQMIHLAWEGLPNYKSTFHIDENLPTHFCFLSNLIKNGLKDITVTGTCFEYGMQEGCLSENMVTDPSNPYAKAKDLLRKKLEDFGREYPFALKWIRLFYMYGKGQNPDSLLSQLDKAIANGDEVFNMSGGQQTRDYLPVQKVAEYIVKISLQNNVTGIINCCSGEPVVLKQFVEDYLRKINKTVFLNFGYYPYPDFEPMHFWGNNEKLKTILHNE
jgi:nucleoside-diphosphate-sugar epimerase